MLLQSMLPNSRLNSLATLSLSCSFRPKTSPWSARKPVAGAVPARDRVIEFGKHKGKMLGSLPSSYLRWVSKNLRAGDSEQWAKLADQVLQDPVYRDRIEWEYAENVLSGDKRSSPGSDDGAVSRLLEISERFGWNNDDKAGWSKVDFGLLGTSRGGRIPRFSSASDKEEEENEKEKENEEKVEVLPEAEARRKERRRRMRSRMGKDAEMVNKFGSEGKFENVVEKGIGKNATARLYNPFPGREALLRKALNRSTTL